ncbi:MAG: GNAT family N-acetyltransferase [Aggregatilineales bacterium]
MIQTRVATEADTIYLEQHYRHISEAMFRKKLSDSEYMLILDNDIVFGWLRWGYFWDEIPFMNMLHIAENQRAQGYGRQLVTAWENLMQSRRYEQVMTSTLSNEPAQHFYRRLGYVDSGALLLPDEPLEIIFAKILDAR